MRTPLSIKFVALAALGFVGAPVAAQDVMEHKIGASVRSLHPGKIPNKTKVLKSTPPSDEAIAAVKRILDVIGLAPRITLRASMDVSNAEAFLQKGGNERLILYNPQWLQDLLQKLETDWTETSILAHEIGHHLQGNIDPAIDSKQAELEADRWSGFVLQRLGASKDSAQLALAVVTPSSATNGYPSRDERLKAIREGWGKAAASKSPSATTAAVARPPIQLGPPAPAETDKTRISAFTYQTPPQEVDPGLSSFKREADGTWSNTYPSGFVDKGNRILSRVILDGCNGTAIGKDSEPDFAVFIPDKGCPGMMARWRRGAGHWNILGPMQNVR